MDQAGLIVDEQRLHRRHSLSLALDRRHARQHGPSLCDEIDACLLVVLRPERLAVVEEGARVPATVPGRALQCSPPAQRRVRPAFGAQDIAALACDGREVGHQPAKKPGQPHRFATPFDADAVHAVVPVAAAHQRQAVCAHAQTVVDGPRRVLVDRRLLRALLRRAVVVLGALGDHLALDEGHALVKQGGITSGIQVVGQCIGQPQQVV